MSCVSWSFDVFAYTLLCQEYVHSNISLFSLAVCMLDWAASGNIFLGLIGQHASSCVSLQRRWLVGWVNFFLFSHQVWNFTSAEWIMLKHFKKWILLIFQFNLNFLRLCTPRLKIIFFITFSLTFQEITHKPLNIEKYEYYYWKKTFVKQYR